MIKHFTKVTDLSKEEIIEIIRLSKKLHAEKEKNIQKLAGKNVLFCFEKPSLRTLVGTESALNQLGASAIHTAPDVFLGSNIVHTKKNSFGERESLKDTVKNIQEFCDAVFVRVFSHSTVEKLKELSAVPVVNALCDEHHPMQALADLLTIEQQVGEQKVCISFIGDSNNVTFSLFQIALTMGHSVIWAGPKEYSFSSEKIDSLRVLEKKFGGKLELTHDPFEAAKKSDFIYADTFISMGEESEYDEKMKYFKKFQINSELWKHCSSTTKFMHCLPAHRNIEVTDQIIDGDQSIIYEQAKNRMVTAKGLFAFLLS